MGILSWVIWGLFVGAIARLLRPGRQAIGFLWTIALGVAGSLIGGFLATEVIDIADSDEFDFGSFLIAKNSYASDPSCTRRLPGGRSISSAVRAICARCRSDRSAKSGIDLRWVPSINCSFDLGPVWTDPNRPGASAPAALS